MSLYKILSMFFVLLLSFNTFAESSWREKMNPLLPDPLSKFVIMKTSQKTVSKLLGKAALVEKNKHYYVRNNFKYALELSFNKGLLKEMHYTFTENRPAMKMFNLDPKFLKQESDKFLKYTDENGELTIDVITQTIYSVRIIK